MKRPLVTVAAGFVLGEVLGLHTQVAVSLNRQGELTVLAAALAVLCAALGWRAVRSRSVRKRAVLLFFALFLAGMGAGGWRAAGKVQELEEKAALAGQWAGKQVHLKGKIEKWQQKEKLLSFELGECEPDFGRVLVYVDEETLEGFLRRSGGGEGEPLFGVGRELEIIGEAEGISRAKNPGEFDFSRYYRGKGVVCRMYAKKLMDVSGEAVPYFRGIDALKAHCRRVLETVCEPEDSMVYKAILLGEGSAMEADLKELYQRSGIAHLLAVSGQHLSIIGGGIYIALRRLGLGFGKAGLAGGALVISYGILTGSSGSAMRAVIMILCLWLAAREGKTYDTLSALGLAAVLLLWEQPYILLQSGFQLSFGAVWAIAGPGAWLDMRLKLEKTWQRGLLISLCIQLALLPVMLWHYYQYPLYGLLLNLLILPLVALLMYSGLLVIVLGSFWMEAAAVAAIPGHSILLYYHWLCRLSARLPGYCLVLGRPKWWQLAAYGAVAALLLWCVVLWRERQEEKGGSLCSLMAVVVIFAMSFFLLLPLPVQGLEILCLDVGQGDGFLLRTGRRTVLVDGGSSSEKKLGEMTLEPCLKSMGVTSVDCAIVSHGDNDHISGLLYLLKEGKDIKIKRLILPARGRGQQIYETLEALQREAGGETLYMTTGDEIQVGALSMNCIYGGEAAAGTLSSSGEERNAHSLVLCADYEGLHMLFTGDMGAEQERALLRLSEEANDGLQARHLSHVQVLKVAHHGSGGSSDQAFLERLPLKLALLSYGKDNSYGHPSGQVLKRLEQLGVLVLKTGGRGAIRLNIKGKGLEAGYWMKHSENTLK